MEIKAGQIENIEDYTNILITDDKGVVLFYDSPDLGILKNLGINPSGIIGRKVISFYSNITEENSTILSVLKTGKALLHKEQELLTRKENKVLCVNSCYPILEEDKVVGALEFSRFFYPKEESELLDRYSRHKIFRKNNTIFTIDDIVTVNPVMLDIKERIVRLAKTDSSVMIYGKTGTGKEVAAQAIHNLSPRFNEPFLSVNCGAIPPTLLESLLFGTEKGSFTGSVEARGLFEQANGGTLFLDEINSLEYHLQVKLLKAIEEKAVKRIGGSKYIPLDIRIISATNEHPDKVVAERKLREDLFYRLGVVQLNLPELAERKEDIPGLLDTFIAYFNGIMNIQVEGVDPDVLECFYRYSWPGNIREFKNAVEAAFNSVTTSRITLGDIPERVRSHGIPAASWESPTRLSRPLKEVIEDYEKRIIEDELARSNFRSAEAAGRLGISKQLLKYKIEKYRLL